MSTMTREIRRAEAMLEHLDVEAVEAAIDLPRQRWAHECHAVSLAIVRARLFPVARVARGVCRGVGPHSWVVVGRDPYDGRTPLLDATLWSYDASQPVLWTGTYADGLHVPAGGHGTIWQWGKPEHRGGPTITFDRDGLSGAACEWLDRLEPLDGRGWASLFQAPVAGWPAREIIERAYLDRRFRALVPIDRAGMLTDLNPSGLYLPVEHGESDG